ncbi:MAG: hypothetical protein AAGF77_04665 [Bacteroidota bacterium]
MGKNAKTYVLLAIVAGVWGLIAYRVVGSLSSEPVESTALAPLVTKSLSPIQRDTFLIRADYRDPFLGTMPKAKTVKPKRTLKPKKPAPPQLAIAYVGTIRNSSAKDHIYFVTIAGTQYLLQQGKQAEGVTLVSGTEHDITVKHEGRLRKIKRQ